MGVSRRDLFNNKHNLFEDCSEKIPNKCNFVEEDFKECRRKVIGLSFFLFYYLLKNVVN